jgi:putative ABC transport system substrate-binding protein
MQRRDFITVLGGAAAFWPLGARAQQSPERVARIAFLGAGSSSTVGSNQIDVFKKGLLENGLVEGRNIIVDYVWADGRAEGLGQLAEDLAKRNLDIIVTVGAQPVLALMATRMATPIVFAIVGDPIASGVVKSLARPGGSVTGLSMSNAELETKRIEVLKEVVPPVTRLMILHHSSTLPATVAEAVAAARTLEVEPDVVEASYPDQFEEAFERAIGRSVNGIATMASPFLSFWRKQWIELATRHRLPSVWEGAGYVDDGGLLSYGPSFPDMFRRSAGYVAKILNGARPADLPVEQPIRFVLAVNLKTAKSLGIVIPPTLLARADEVVE